MEGNHRRRPPALPFGQNLPSHPRVGRKSHLAQTTQPISTSTDSQSRRLNSPWTPTLAAADARRATTFTETSRYSQASWRSSTCDPALLWPGNSTLPRRRTMADRTQEVGSELRTDGCPTGPTTRSHPAPEPDRPFADADESDSWSTFVRQVAIGLELELDHRPAGAPPSSTSWSSRGSTSSDEEGSVCSSDSDHAPSVPASPLALRRAHRPAPLLLDRSSTPAASRATGTMGPSNVHLSVPSPPSASSRRPVDVQQCSPAASDHSNDDAVPSPAPTPRSPSSRKVRSEWRSGLIVPLDWSFSGERQFARRIGHLKERRRGEGEPEKGPLAADPAEPAALVDIDRGVVALRANLSLERICLSSDDLADRRSRMPISSTGPPGARCVAARASCVALSSDASFRFGDRLSWDKSSSFG